MEIRSLRYFVHVARARSFSRAALDLRVAQPALSRQIKKLEEEVGAELFLRTARGLEITATGSHLLERAETLIQQMADALEDTRAVGSGLSGRLAIGVSPATCEVLPPLIARECARRHPHLRLAFVEGFSGFIFKQLMSQDLALTLLHNPPLARGVQSEPLLDEAMLLIGPGSGSQSLPPVNSAMKLEDLPLILPNPDHALRRAIATAFGERAARLQVSVQTDGVITTRALVAAGLGYTILPFGAVHQELANGRLSSVRLEGLRIPWSLCLSYLTTPRPSRIVLAVAEIIRAEVDALLDEGEWGDRATVADASQTALNQG
jgi:LysR family nitrogen assimilation transcriptional regulator